MADKSLNRTELVAAVAAESGQSQAAVSSVFDALFSTLAKNVADGTKVAIPGWLAVERTHRACAHRPQPADRRGDPDQGELRREGQRRQQAQGCRQGRELTQF